ncbi:MAG: sulfatase [Proteobacteria bacterium]|nr:sulfatase [Pseudomonadota bacterium]
MSLVIIVADSLRHDMLGCYRGPARTPVVDRLAAEGTLFERVISASPWTVPSIASMLTGVYSHRLGLAKWEQPWPTEYPSLFDLAATQGFEVASFVFDPSHLFSRVPVAGVKGSSQNVDALISWLKERQNRRYVLFVHYWWTHVPYLARPTTTAAWLEVTKKVLATMRTGEKARNGVKSLYRLAVEKFSEEWLPRLLEVLDLETTWLAITSDHGESWGERAETAQLKDVFDLHGNTLYDEVLRVPLIIRPPSGGKAYRASGLARTVDLMPTLSDLLNLPFKSSQLDGVSLSESVLGGSTVLAEEAVSVANQDFVDLPGLPEDPRDLWCALALSTHRYKQIWEPATNCRKAFDIQNDPNETVDVSADLAKELEPGWQRLKEEFARARVGKILKEEMDQTHKRLSQLGYID